MSKRFMKNHRLLTLVSAVSILAGASSAMAAETSTATWLTCKGDAVDGATVLLEGPLVLNYGEPSTLDASISIYVPQQAKRKIDEKLVGTATSYKMKLAVELKSALAATADDAAPSAKAAEVESLQLELSTGVVPSAQLVLTDGSHYRLSDCSRSNRMPVRE
jgi:hypothetical protein